MGGNDIDSALRLHHRIDQLSGFFVAPGQAGVTPR